MTNLKTREIDEFRNFQPCAVTGETILHTFLAADKRSSNIDYDVFPRSDIGPFVASKDAALRWTQRRGSVLMANLTVIIPSTNIVSHTGPESSAAHNAKRLTICPVTFHGLKVVVLKQPAAPRKMGHFFRRPSE